MANPFSPISGSQMGLGAVGGPRGVGAGTLRVLVEFLTQYDSAALKQLEADQARLISDEQSNTHQLEQTAQKREALETRIYQLKLKRNSLDAPEQAAVTQIVRAYERIERLDKSRMNTARAVAEYERLIREYLYGMGGPRQSRGAALTEAELRDVSKLVEYSDEVRHLNEQINILKATGVDIENELKVATKATNDMLTFRANLLPKLGSLMLGAFGGLAFGAVAGIGFQAVQGAMDAIATGVRDIIDPANKARENVGKLADEIERASGSKAQSDLEAVQGYLQNLGEIPRKVGGGNQSQLEEILQLAIQTKRLEEITDQFNKVQDQFNHGQQIMNEKVRDLLSKLLILNPRFEDLAKILSDVTAGSVTYSDLLNVDPSLMEDVATLTDQGKEAWKEFMGIRDALLEDIYAAAGLRDTTSEVVDEARKAREAFQDVFDSIQSSRLDQAFSTRISSYADATDRQIDRVQEKAEMMADNVRRSGQSAIEQITQMGENRVKHLQAQLDRINSGPSARTRGIQNSLNNLSNDPSARTNRLAAAVERLGAAEARRQFRQRLANIDDEKSLLILQRRLATTDRAIRIENYSGKARIIAIDATIDRLRKQQEEQDRLNKLIEMQHEASRRIMRNEGETIQDYLARRSLEYRKQITERASMEREDQISRLEGQKDGIEYQLKLEELRDQKIELLRQKRQQNEEKRLRAALKSSQDYDRKVYESRRKSLQDSLKASQDADRKAADSQRKAIREQIEAERERTQKTIEQIRKQNEERQKQIQEQAKKQVAALKASQKVVEAAEAAKAEAIKRFATKAETDRYNAAMKGAKTLGELNAIAGSVAGSQFAYNQLMTSIANLGLPPIYTAGIMANAAAQRAMYMKQLNALQRRPPMGGRAKGGFFEVTNALNFGNNIRAGEEGTEIGLILSNKVAQALKDKKGSSGPTTIYVESHGDPYRDAYVMQRRLEEQQAANLK